MYSLFNVLTSQHDDEFAPVKCNHLTVTRLVSYFEDVVTENKLSALVVEGRCLDGDPHRASERIAKLAAWSRHLCLFSCDSTCSSRTWRPDAFRNLTLLEDADHHNLESGPFILIMESRFAGLLATSVTQSEDESQPKNYEMIWTFDPNVVFTAIEYLMARVGVQSPKERRKIEGVLNACTPRSSSLRMALTFATKLTMLMQRQSELEMATSRISALISSALEMDQILRPAVTEVGRALKARHAAVVLFDELTGGPETMEVYDRGADERANQPTSLAEQPPFDHRSLNPPGPLQVPINYRKDLIGELLVEDDTPGRTWEPEENLMANTVAHQLSIAISHARLFKQMETQAMTDALTGLYNRRYFQERLERETKLADRNNQPVSLILLDLDHLKLINDTHGHRSGDSALRHVALTMLGTVREVDVCARYGGEEFVVILTQCAGDDAVQVAERLREAIASTPVPNIGQVTASIGVATYPTIAKSKEQLIEKADQAMYLAKAAGRNRVRTPMHRKYSSPSPPVTPATESQVVE
jgi:diguanylate cyclase (GGDEF)-like protein